VSRARRVVVVGAGLAGLCAAFRLRRAGASVTVVEGRDRLPASEPDTELGPLPPALPGQAPELLGLARELGLGKSLTRRAIPRPRIAGASPLGLARDPDRGLFGESPLAWVRVRRLRRLLRWYAFYLDARVPERGVRLDDRSAADWARLYVGDRAYREAFATRLGVHLCLSGESVSRLLAISLLDPLGRVSLEHLDGLPALERALAESLPDIRLGVPVASVDPRGRAVALATGEIIDADAVLLAGSAAEALALLPDPSPAEAVMLSQIRYQPRVQLTLRLAGPRPADPVLWIAPRACPVLAAILDRGALCADERDRGADVWTAVLVVRPEVAADHLGTPERAFIDTVLYAADRQIPNVRSRVKALAAWRDASVPSFDVGHYRAVARLRVEAEARPDRAVHLAGDYLVAPHAEGAVAAGVRAASDCLSRLPAREERAKPSALRDVLGA
jgi:protoporphyrinogen/coproporphyrinogen III oxidase